VASYIITFLLFLLPFIILPFGASVFEIPKVIVAEIGIELLFLIKFFEGKFYLKKYKRYSLYTLGLMVILTLGHLIFLRTANTFFGNVFRLQGVFLLWNLIAFAVLSSLIELKFMSVLPWIAIILLFTSTFLFGGNLSGRAVGTLGEPNALAGVAVFLWPFLYFLKKHKFLPKILFLILTFGLPAVIIFLSGSRSGIVAFLLQIFFIILAKSKKFSLGKTVCIIVFLLILSYSLPFIEKVGRFESRSDVWKTAIAAGFEHPLSGGGFGNTDSLIHTASLTITNNIRYQFVDSSHNIFIDWFVQGGLLGLSLLLFLTIRTIQTFIKSKNIFYLTLMFGLLTVLSFNPASVVMLVAFWWTIGQGLINSN
jgi:hypothetical protein